MPRCLRDDENVKEMVQTVTAASKTGKPTAETGPSGKGKATTARPLVPGIPSRVVDPSGVVKAQQKASHAGSRGAAAPRKRAEDDAPSAAADAGRLFIGEGVSFKGELTKCETFVVAGTVEATLPGGALEVLETGRFSGSATVDSAVIAGRFEGNLTVRADLVVAETAQVRGRLRYGKLDVKPGGLVSGDIGLVTEDTAPDSSAYAGPQALEVEIP